MLLPPFRGDVGSSGDYLCYYLYSVHSSQVTAACPLLTHARTAFLAHSRFSLSRVVPSLGARNPVKDSSRKFQGNLQVAMIINSKPLQLIAIGNCLFRVALQLLVTEYATLLRRSVSQLVVVPIPVRLRWGRRLILSLPASYHSRDLVIHTFEGLESLLYTCSI